MARRPLFRMKGGGLYGPFFGKHHKVPGLSKVGDMGDTEPPDPPAFLGTIPDQNAFEEEQFFLDVKPYYSTGGPITQWSLIGAPAGMIISGGVIRWTPPLGAAGVETIQVVGNNITGPAATSNPFNITTESLPKIADSEVDAAGTKLIINLTEEVTGNQGFTFKADGKDITLSLPANNINQITFTCDTVFVGQELRLSYEPGNVTGLNSNPLRAFQNFPVTNNAIGSPAPEFTGNIPDFNESVGRDINPFNAANEFTGNVDTWQLLSAPPWMTIDSQGLITGRPTDDTDYPTATVRAVNSNGEATSNPFAVIVAAAVIFIAQPISQLVESGNPVTMAVIADNVITYQWYRNSIAISGANAPEYTFIPANNTDAYFCRCVNANGDYWDSNVAYAYPVIRYSNQVLNPGDETLALIQQTHTVSVVGAGVLTVTGNIEAA